MNSPDTKECDQPILPDGRTALVAGSGQLPLDVAAALRASGHEPFVMMIEGQADQALSDYDHIVTTLGGLGLTVSRVLSRGIGNLVMAGGVRGRPSIWSCRADRHMLLNAMAVLAALRRGDNALLSVLTAMIERSGIRVIGAHDIVPGNLVGEGAMGRHAAGARDEGDIALAWRAAKAIGELDIGQGAVSIGGRVVALEGVEGTDDMLARVAGLRVSGRIGPEKGGVLVKCIKPNQEMRADLPTIGPETVERAKAAGLSGIVVEAGHALIMNRAETVAAADGCALFIEGRSHVS
jgi:DUF1009 family protein